MKPEKEQRNAFENHALKPKLSNIPTCRTHALAWESGKLQYSARETTNVELTQKKAQQHCETGDLAATNLPQDNALRGAEQGPATSLRSSDDPGAARSGGLEEAGSLRSHRKRARKRKIILFDKDMRGSM